MVVRNRVHKVIRPSVINGFDNIKARFIELRSNKGLYLIRKKILNRYVLLISAGYAGISLEKDTYKLLKRVIDKGHFAVRLLSYMIETHIKGNKGYIRIHRDWDSHCQKGHARHVRDHKEVAADRPGGLHNWDVSPTL